MYTPPDELIVSRGARCMVALAVRQSGRCESREFLDGLPLPDSAKLLRRFEAMAQTGKFSNDLQFKHLEDGIYEFKGDRFLRVLAFKAGSTYYLTHGYRKQTNKCPRSEINRAKTVRAEHPTSKGEG